MKLFSLSIVILVVGGILVCVESLRVQSRHALFQGCRKGSCSKFHHLGMLTSDVSDKITIPDINQSESDRNTPVPKVPAAAWRWPPSWPFPADYLDSVSTKDKKLSSLDSSPALKNHLQYFIASSDRVLEITSDSPVLTQINVDSKSCTITEFSAAPDSFRLYDVVLITSGVESLLDPRSFFKSVWKSLKPGGFCYTCFYGLPAPSVDYAAKMWTTMTDEQKIWIAGSYFQYSVNDGWTSIEGYDVLDKNTTQLVFEKSDVPTSNKVYSVRAQKAISVGTFDNAISYELLPLDNIDSDDRTFLTSRLTAMVSDVSSSGSNIAAVLPKIGTLSQIYLILKDVGDNILPKSIKAMLASLLVTSWTNSPSQISALKRGVGAEKSPDDLFWPALSQQTTKLAPREKILLLADVVANWDQSRCIDLLPAALAEVSKKLSQKLDVVDETISQQLAVDLVVSDFLLSPKSDALNRILRFIEDSNASKLSAMARK